MGSSAAGVFLDKSDGLSHIFNDSKAGVHEPARDGATKGKLTMPSREDRRFECLDALFGALVRERYGEFLAGCTEDLVLNVRGSARMATSVPREQIARWHRSKKHLAGGNFRSSVCFVLVTEHEAIVVLTHLIDRSGVTYRYETANHCTLQEDFLLRAWFNYPIDASDYALAWDLQQPSDPQPAV
jgi:ketosteroid isomerase-like protein